MRKFGLLVLISGLVLGTAACSGDTDAPEADSVTEIQMDDVDVIDGTISDDMVDLDAQTSGDELADGEEVADSDNPEAADDENSGEETAE